MSVTKEQMLYRISGRMTEDVLTACKFAQLPEAGAGGGAVAGGGAGAGGADGAGVGAGGACAGAGGGGGCGCGGAAAACSPFPKALDTGNGGTIADDGNCGALARKPFVAGAAAALE
ncbi:uncharacterized protein LOC135824288 [Sycon ciliatum]|uniref:uncharacterized protein LOC135824288 n=1 Tax=Sycon ciliatum TaxID=27933 RepID=UPI0031F69939